MVSRILYGVLGCILVACNGNYKNKAVVKDGKLYMYTINSDSIKTVFASQIIDSSSIRVIPLMTNEREALTYIEKVEVYDGRYYVLDRSHSHALFVFDSLGNVVRVLRKFADTSANFEVICDFLLDQKSGELHLLVDGNKVISYSKIGEYRGVVSLPYHAIRFAKLGGRGYLFYSGYTDNSLFFKNSVNYNLILSDEKGKVHAVDLPYDRDSIRAKDVIAPYTISSYTHLNQFITVPGSATVYRTEDNMLSPSVSYTFKKEGGSNAGINGGIHISRLDSFLASGYLSGHPYSRHGDIDFFSFYNNELLINCLFDRKRKMNVCFKGIVNDYNLVPLALPAIGLTERDIICYFRSSDLLLIYNSIIEKQQKDAAGVKGLTEILDKCHENELVLVRFRLKENLAL